MKGILLFGVTFCLIFTARAGEFMGTMKFVRYSNFDTSYYFVTIGKEDIRIDVADEHQKTIETCIYDYIENKGVMLSPEKRQYLTLSQPLFNNNNTDEDFSFVKTENYRIINNLKCYQWRVKNEKLSTEIEYWVTNFDFPLLSKLNNFDGKANNLITFFRHIPDNDGYIPVESIEYNLFREIKDKLCLLEIIAKQPEASVFEIPSNYTKVL